MATNSQASGVEGGMRDFPGVEKLGAEIFPPVNSDSISISGSESVLCKSDVLDFEAEPRAAVVKYPGDGLFLDSSDEQKAISSAGGVRGINFSPEMQVAMRLPEQSAVAHAVSGGDSALAEAIRREGGARRVDILPAARGGMLSEEQAALAFSHIGGVSTASSTRLPPSSSSVLGKLKSAPQYLSPHNVAVEGKDVLWVNFAVHEACSETGAVFDQSTEKNKFTCFLLASGYCTFIVQLYAGGKDLIIVEVAQRKGSSAVASSFFSVLVGKLGVQPPRPVRRPMAMLPPPLPEDLQDDAADESPIDTYSPLIAMINSEMYTTALEALMCLANLAETPASLAALCQYQPMVAAVFSVVEKKDPVTTPLLFAYAALVLSKVSALSTGADTLVAVLQEGRNFTKLLDECRERPSSSPASDLLELLVSRRYFVATLANLRASHPKLVSNLPAALSVEMIEVLTSASDSSDPGTKAEGERGLASRPALPAPSRTGSWPASKGASVAEPEQPAVVREVLAPSNFTVDAASFVKIFSLMIALTVAYGAPFKANGKKCKVTSYFFLPQGFARCAARIYRHATTPHRFTVEVSRRDGSSMIVSRYFRELAKCVTNNEISASLLPLYAASPMLIKGMKVSSQDFEAGLAPLRFQLQSKNSKAVLEGSLAACSLASEGFTETAVANHPGFITDLVTAFTTRGQSVTAKTALAQALEIISTCDAGARNVAGAVSGAIPEVVEALSGPTTFDTIHLRRFLLKLLSNLLVQGLLSGTHVKELTRSFRECSGPDVGDGCVVALADKCMKASSSLIGVM